MPGVTKEQIARAKEWDLLSYLQAYEPGELKRCGNEYCTVSHDSLRISNGKWHWHSQGVGGRTALDYLIKVRQLDFVAAVETLCGYCPPPKQERPKPKPPKSFTLPEANRYGTAAVSYLQERGIDPDIISRCISAGVLYESRRYQNCVFVGKDPSGTARFACLRGIYDGFKLDVEGSDKRYSFSLSPFHPCGSVAVAESPIDALSVAGILKMQGMDWQDCHYLSLGGTAPRALLQFLHDHPEIKRISLCLDNDKAGLEGMKKIEEAVRTDRSLSERIALIWPNPPPLSFGKDYNEFLKAIRKQYQPRVAKETCR